MGRQALRICTRPLSQAHARGELGEAGGFHLLPPEQHPATPVLLLSPEKCSGKMAATVHPQRLPTSAKPIAPSTGARVGSRDAGGRASYGDEHRGPGCNAVRLPLAPHRTRSLTSPRGLCRSGWASSAQTCGPSAVCSRALRSTTEARQRAFLKGSVACIIRTGRRHAGGCAAAFGGWHVRNGGVHECVEGPRPGRSEAL